MGNERGCLSPAADGGLLPDDRVLLLAGRLAGLAQGFAHVLLAQAAAPAVDQPLDVLPDRPAERDLVAVTRRTSAGTSG
jgi:glycine cleavage system regulatory protein